MLTLNVPPGRYADQRITQILQASTTPIQASIGFTETEAGRAYKAWLIPEDGLTDGDGRLYVGPIQWRAERLPFTFSDVEGDPHEEARHVGNLDNLRREMRDGESWVVADVDWDNDELALEAKRLVDEGRITGVSVHPTEAEGWMICGVPSNPSAELIRQLGTELDEETWANCQEPILAFVDVVIGAATLLMLPAFDDAGVETVSASTSVTVTQPVIDFVVSGNTVVNPQGYSITFDGKTLSDGKPWAPLSSLADLKIEGLTSEEGQAFHDAISGNPIQAAASLDRPPKEWFDFPEPDAPTPLTVTDDGQVFGHLAVWDTCHTGFQGRCVTPPRDTDYSYFQTARVITADGSRIPVGPLVVDDGHAPANWTVEKVVRYYSDTRLAAAYVTIRSGEHGPWATGAVSHKATPGQVETLRRHSLSGDWRKLEGKTRLIAAVSVNGPGFVVPEVLVASGEDVGLITYGPEPLVDEPSDLALVAAALTRLTSLVEAVLDDRDPSIDPATLPTADEVFGILAEPDDELEAEVEVALALNA